MRRREQQRRNAHAVAALSRVSDRLRGVEHQAAQRTNITTSHPLPAAAAAAAVATSSLAKKVADDGTARPSEESGPTRLPAQQQQQQRELHELDQLKEGQEKGAVVPLDVKQHVSWMIQQATSPENLCLMYEGWAAWC